MAGDLAEQAEAVLADGGILGNIFLGDGSGFGPGGGAALGGWQRRQCTFHPGQCPMQIYRRWPG
jgi:hypothetical protein